MQTFTWDLNQTDRHALPALIPFAAPLLLHLDRQKIHYGRLASSLASDRSIPRSGRWSPADPRHIPQAGG